jgi:transposase-like protein
MHQILDQLLEASSQSDMQRRFEEVSGEIEEKAPGAIEVLEGGLFDATAVLALPGKYRRRLRTTNMVGRFIEEIRRWEKVIRIFPNIGSVERLVGALFAETHEEGSTGRRYLKMEEFLEWQAEKKSAADNGLNREHLDFHLETVRDPLDLSQHPSPAPSKAGL